MHVYLSSSKACNGVRPLRAESLVFGARHPPCVCPVWPLQSHSTLTVVIAYVCVSGEWLVLAWDDTCWWNGVHPSLARILSIQERPQGNLNFVSLGPDGTYCALFDNRTVWRAKQSFTDHMLQDIV